jgi:hypothetical protein
MITSKFSQHFLSEVCATPYPEMKKFRTLKKKIRRLEARLQKGEKRLAKLKQKLGAAETRAAAKPKSKKDGVKPTAAAKGTGAVKSVKRKLNLTPERREQLAAAMRARWAAKRAAAGTNTQQSSAPQSGDTSQPQ